MKWSMKQPNAGDMIRVKSGSIYHYGIFVSEDEVIQFGLAPSARPELKASDIKVCVSDIDAFLVGGFLEVAEFDRLERRKNRKPKEIVAYARESIGRDGYHLLYNNCEHFAYECVTGKKYSSQTEDVRAHFRALPVVDVYLCPIPEEWKMTPVVPAERNEEIERVSNSRVKAEKYYVWRLLEYALERSFGLKMEKLRFEKTENGKWLCDLCAFSLSHCSGAVAVAVSRAPVGVDVETQRVLTGERLADHILTENEKTLYAALAEAEKPLFLLRTWTKKESLFKREGGKALLPATIETTDAKVYCETVELDGKNYTFSVATDTPEVVRVYTNPNALKR